MLPKNPLQRLSLARIVSVRDHLSKLCWRHVGTVQVAMGSTRERFQPLSEADDETFSPIEPGAACGQSVFDYTRFKLAWDEPATAGARTWLKWNHQGESTVFLGTTPWAGFDREHFFHPLPQGVTSLVLDVMASNPGKKLVECGLYQRDDDAWNAFYDFEVWSELLDLEAKTLGARGGSQVNLSQGFCYHAPLDSAPAWFRRLLRRLEDACDAFDRDGAKGALGVLQVIKSEFRSERRFLDICATGHSHLDLVWLWPEHAGEFKAVHTFSSMHRLLDEYPELRFGYSQPASYAAVERLAPALHQSTRKLIADQRWEAEGAMYVESDCLLPCGEALARSFLLGQEDTRRLTGNTSRVLWLPDAFGFPACLPTIMRQAGVDRFYSTKMHWNPISHFPHSSFTWIGADGSQVLAHLSQHQMGYTLDARVKEMRNIEEVYRQATVHDESLACVGHGDGGGGVSYAQCERMRRLADMHGVPRTTWGTIAGFFDRLEKVAADLPEFAGELYLEYHRGCYTNQSRIKAVYRRAETALQTLEAAHMLAASGPIPRKYWERLVFHQFHDWLPGSSINEVYRLSEPEVTDLARNSLAAAAETLGGAGTAGYFNPLALARSVELTAETGFPRILDLPPLGYAPVSLARIPEPVRASVHQIGGLGMVVDFDENGQITACAINGRSLLLKGPAARLAIYPEHPANFGSWDIDRQSLANGSWVTTAATAAVENDGALTFTRSVGCFSRITTRYRLSPIAPVLLIELEVDWRDPHALLKLHFPTAYQAPSARFGGPFGSILRPQRPGMEAAEAIWEAPGSRWACVADEGERQGLFLVTESKYGFSCRDGNLALSLLRSPAPPGTASDLDTSTHDWHKTYTTPLAEDTWQRPLTDLGSQVIRLAVGFFDRQAPRESQPAALADTLFTPAIGLANPLSGTSGFEGLIGGESLVPCWVVPEPSGRWILRLHETLGEHGCVRIMTTPGWNLSRTDLSGKHYEPLVNNELKFRPYDLVSIRFSQ